MRYFILALILHGLLFLKLSINRVGKGNPPIKHSVAIEFRQIKASSPPLASVTEIVAPIVEQPPKQEVVKEKPVEKKVVEKREPIKKEKPQPKKSVKKKVVNKEVEKKEIEPTPVPENSSVPTGTTGGSGIPSGDKILQNNGDGTYTALSNNGIRYKIIKEVDPIYPKQAETIKYKKRVVVKAKFLVDEKGEVQNITIVQSHKKLGFDGAVISALKKWRFAPIHYNNEIIRVYFQKEFVFESKK